MKTIKGSLAGLGVPAKLEEERKPLSFEELRYRLKHIAGLCWGLSIDLANEIQLREETASENARLQAENDGLQKEVQRLSKELYFKNYHSKKRLAQ